MMNRRSLFLGAASLLVAPTIVRAGSLMPVKAPKLIPASFMAVDPGGGDLVGAIIWSLTIDHDGNIVGMRREPSPLGETLGEIAK